MADTNEALKIWEAIRPMIDKEIADQTESCVRAKKMIVKQPTMEDEDGSVLVGVAEPYESKIIIPSGTQLSNVVPGSPVWVYWYMNNASTMHVALNGDGSPGTADTERLEDLLNQEIENRENALGDLEDAFNQTANNLYSYIEYTASNLWVEFTNEMDSLRSYVEVTASNLYLEFENFSESMRSYIEITASHLYAEFDDFANSLRSYVEITASHLYLEFDDFANSLRSYVELTASHLYLEFDDFANSLRSYVELTASHLYMEFDDFANSLRSYVELTASHLYMEFDDFANSLRSYVELTASHLYLEFDDFANSLRSYVELTASHLYMQFDDFSNSLRSYVELTASHLYLEFDDFANSLRSYVELTASHLYLEFDDFANSLRSYVELTASHLYMEFDDFSQSMRSYIELTASHLYLEFDNFSESMRSYLELTASHLYLEFDDFAQSMRSYVEITASHLYLEFDNFSESMRSYLELTASHLYLEFDDFAESMRSYVELTASHLYLEFDNFSESMRSYVELTASHLYLEFDNFAGSMRSYLELTASILHLEFDNEITSLRSYVEIQADRISMNVSATDENSSILRQAGMYINDQGVLVYATDNQNNIGAKLNVLSNEISAKVGKSEVTITNDSVTIGSQSISFVGYVTADNISTYFLAGDDATFGYLEATTLDVDSINVQGSISTDYINGHDPDAAIASFGTATASGGSISIPTTTLGGTAGPSINFNIADTQFYKDGVAAAAAGVTLSGSWSSARYTATASNGASVNSGYVYIAGAASNAYFSSGTSLIVVADIIAGGSTIRSNDTTSINILSQLQSANTLSIGEWSNNKATVTSKINGTSVKTMEVDASSIYTDGADSVTLTPSWQSYRYTVTASNGAQAQTGFMNIKSPANSASFTSGTTLRMYTDILAGSDAIRSNDYADYNIQSILASATTIEASTWVNDQSTITAAVNGVTVKTLTITAPPSQQMPEPTDVYISGVTAGDGTVSDCTVRVIFSDATSFRKTGVSINTANPYNAGKNSVQQDGSITLNSSYSPTYFPSTQSISVSVKGTLTNGNSIGGTVLISGGAVQDAYDAGVAAASAGSYSTGWIDGYNAAVDASGKSGDTVTVPTTTSSAGSTPTTSYSARASVNDTHYISFPASISLVPGQTFTGAAGNYVYKNSVELKGTSVAAVYWV